MLYPTMEQVMQADRLQLARWYRFLPGPGSAAIGTPAFDEVLDSEAKIMDQICDRFKEG